MVITEYKNKGWDGLVKTKILGVVYQYRLMLEGHSYHELGDNTFVIEWFVGINCIILQIILQSQMKLTRRRSGKTGIFDRKMIQFMPTNHSNINLLSPF